MPSALSLQPLGDEDRPHVHGGHVFPVIACTDQVCRVVSAVASCPDGPRARFGAKQVTNSLPKRHTLGTGISAVGCLTEQVTRRRSRNVVGVEESPAWRYLAIARRSGDSPQGLTRRRPGRVFASLPRAQCLSTTVFFVALLRWPWRRSLPRRCFKRRTARAGGAALSQRDRSGQHGRRP
jgi:hypothetical protein